VDRLAAVLIAWAFASILLADVASAQELAALHVHDFDLSADRTSVRVGEAFHVTITARLGERLTALDNVTLPNLSGFEELGDERRCSDEASGSTCSETLTLDATKPGDQTIGAATLAAIDARTGRPSRFITGTLAIHIAPGGGDVRETLYSLAESVLRFALIGLFLLVAGAALWWGYRRRPARAPALAFEPAPVPLAADADLRPPDFGSLVEALSQEPTRERVFAVRRALRNRANAREDETLADLVRRRALPDGPAVVALAAVERASFCEETRLPEAIAEALPYLR
jgi:hypothetical protein